MVLTSADQITTEWLTAILKSSGALAEGSVLEFELSGGAGNWSSNAVLKLSYSDDSSGELPQSLFLKMVDTGASSSDECFGESEVAYYIEDYVDVDEAPILRCYDAAFAHDLARYHLLLDDVSETHIEAARKTVNIEYGFALAEGLAVMHARWWGSKGLSDAGDQHHNPAHIQRFVEIAEPGAGHIIDAFSDELRPHWPDVIRSIYAKHPAAIIERNKDAQGFTLIHGDVGHNNVLVPIEGDQPMFLIDRQPFDWSLTTWLGVYDLDYAMVLDWEIDDRRRFEEPVLKRYLSKLTEHGVKDYTWNKLWSDYRLCVAMGVYIATEYCRGGINERRMPVWLPMLQRSLTVCDDLNCQELW